MWAVAYSVLMCCDKIAHFRTVCSGDALYQPVIIIFASAAVAVDSSYMTASSSASWSRFSPPSNFVNEHCRQCGTWSRYGPWPVWKQFIRDHVWRGRRQPGCRIVGSVTIVRLRTEADTMVYVGNLTLVMCRWSGLCVSVFPNVPSAPGQPCTGEDRTLYCMSFKTCYFIFLV